ncbi:alanine-alpha-ketoisovalerate (or valine-pyruvate) aminotransferase [Beggiatoa alba B18LD]|uniref:Alanine-alpha-ketoisovalerate (Or valine-pyruvate) aminotransferase n=1 Tax=Beggiatoa alba B18LD TaxID=395493 RepID=I3CIV4_9GAMM|nr:valine--pyruvate transaminase [Beggiatoa alba]EIJ43547.1 alanine-alpha-ketoisovalerate (or valine-pyruvate) aminotransferase [Beggiatoa alba B18LD]
MQFSNFGQKFTAHTGVLQLMRDLGAPQAEGREMLMLGGGNPSQIPQVQLRLRERMEAVLNQGDEFERVLGNYTVPQGLPNFNKALAGLLRQEYGWQVDESNIALTNGSQTAFFYLMNLFAGTYADGTRKKILLPLAPEYLGYNDLGLESEMFTANKPNFEFLEPPLFKYRINFDTLSISKEIGAICVSRPTNPTGNVLTDEEIHQLDVLARQHRIPLIIDGAYGTPFPNIIFTEAKPIWNDNIVLCLSLSKLGLPAVRTGIVIADPDIIQAISALNAIMSLAPTHIGAHLVEEWIHTGEILRLSQQVIKPFYQHKMHNALCWLNEALDGINFYVHKPEGAFFLWLWFKDLPITSQVLYERLKERGVLVVAGHYFFPGLADTQWQHRHECIRVNYAQTEFVVKQGINTIADVVRQAYAGN